MSTRLRLTKIMTQRPKAPKPPRTPTKLLRGDRVVVIGDHPEKGKQGTIKTMLPSNRCIIENVHVAKKFIKGNPDRGIPGRVEFQERSIPLAQVSLVDPVSNAPTRARYQLLDDGSKVRVAVKSGAVIPRPDILTYRKRPVSSIVTESDTSEADAWEVTYAP